jgi:hypothetical protein
MAARWSNMGDRFGAFAAPPPFPRPLFSLPSKRSASGRVSRIERSARNSSSRALAGAFAIWANREAFSSRSILALAMLTLPLLLLSVAKPRDPCATCTAGHFATRVLHDDPRKTFAPQAVRATTGRAFI